MSCREAPNIGYFTFRLVTRALEDILSLFSVKETCVCEAYFCQAPRLWKEVRQFYEGNCRYISLAEEWFFQQNLGTRLLIGAFSGAEML